MPTAFRALLALPLLLCVALAARADLVGDWNVHLHRLMAEGNVQGNARARATAMAHAAMFEAANAIERRYAPILGRIEAPAGASTAAAVASAAHGIVVQVAPAVKSKADQVLADALAKVDDARAREGGVAVGQRAASAVGADRQDDALAAPDTYRPHTTPGMWVPTVAPLFPEYARAKLWGQSRNDAYRPGPPPALKSAEYARDYNEVKTLGARASTARTAAQTDAVRFWSQANLATTGDAVARQLADAKKLDLVDSTRLFAHMSMAVANTFMADWDAKFHYNFWRPITAIRNGDQDGNDATERDAGWVPLNATPMHPEYPSQAGMVASVVQAVVEQHFGRDAGPLTIVDTANPQLRRTFATAAELAAEMRDVRVWGGVHFRTSLDVSAAMGKRIADDVIRNFAKPAR